jgi:hypothetical protein
MGTKAQTTSTNSYNPQSLSTYQSLQAPSANMQSAFITSPYNNNTYNQAKSASSQVQGAGANARSQAGNQVGNALGTSASSTVGLNQTANLLTGQIAGQTNTTLNIGAAGLRQTALGSAMNYRPLQTGGTQTQTTGGLGAWLTPIIGAATAGAQGLIPQSSAGSNAGPWSTSQYSSALQSSANSPFMASGGYGQPGGYSPTGDAPQMPFNQNGYAASVWGQN